MSSCSSLSGCCPANLCELVLWKNKQLTGAVFGTGLFVYFALFALDYSLLLLLCRLTQLAMLACVGAKFMGKSKPLNEECVQKMIEQLEKRARVTVENVVARVVKPLIDASDLVYVGKLFAVVTVVGMVSSWFATSTLLLLVFVGVFTVPYGYSENKEKVDPLFKQVLDQANRSLGGVLSKVPISGNKSKSS